MVRFDNQRVWFNRDFSLPLGSTNLPNGAFRFSESRPVFWQLQMTQYNTTNFILKVEVVDYNPLETSAFYHQSLKNEIRFLEFANFDWNQLATSLTFYIKNAFEHLLKPGDFIKPAAGGINPAWLFYKIPVKDLTFHAGCVSFKKKFRFEQEETEIKIYNPHILSEFEFIKSYFHRYLGKRYCDVKVFIWRENGMTKKIAATSEEIEMLKDAAIETLKFIKTERIKRLVKKIRPVDKSLFSPEDLYSLDEDDQSAFSKLSQNDIINEILSWIGVRNKGQLEYLSGSIQDVNDKIRFTLTPRFGFLFKHTGRKMYHYLWEMLDSNATYIWSFDKMATSHDQCLDKIEEIISFIRINGRESYINGMSWENDVIFNRIFHKGVGSNFVDHFPKWRNMINELLI